MSAGSFVRSKYEASYAGALNPIHPIRIQPETLLANTGGEVNDPPVDDISNPISAKMSLGKRAVGLAPRYITIQFPSSPPVGYKPLGITKIPALTETFYNAATKGAICEYLGVNCEIISKSPEEAS